MSPPPDADDVELVDELDAALLPLRLQEAARSTTTTASATARYRFIVEFPRMVHEQIVVYWLLGVAAMRSPNRRRCSVAEPSVSSITFVQRK